MCNRCYCSTVTLSRIKVSTMIDNMLLKSKFVKYINIFSLCSFYHFNTNSSSFFLKSWKKIYHFLRFILSIEKGVQCCCFFNFISDKTVSASPDTLYSFIEIFCIFLYMYEYITLSHWRRSACWDSHFRYPEVGEMRPHSWITSSSSGDRKIFLSATVGEQSYSQQLRIVFSATVGEKNLDV